MAWSRPPPTHGPFGITTQHKGDVAATLGALRALEEEQGLDIVGVTVGCESVSHSHVSFGSNGSIDRSIHAFD